MNCSATNNNFFTRKIVVHGVEVEAEFRFFQAIPATADEPESPEEVVVEAVYVDDLDISNLIGPDTWVEIENQILKLYDEKESTYG